MTTPIFASEKTAARLLDLELSVFRKLVEAGHLPSGREIAPGVKRWWVAALVQIYNGDAVDNLGDVKW